MKLYFDKDHCNISEDINGRVIIIETSEPVYIEDTPVNMLLHNQWDNDFGPADEPYLTHVPKDYKL